MTGSSEADALARLYDVDLEDDPGDLDLYQALATKTGGPILELAVGSGRIAVPLATAGHGVTGVDRDPSMLARARLRAQVAGRSAAARLTLVEADLRTVRVQQPDGFRLAFIALNSLLVLGDRRDQARAFEALARHLTHDGMAVVDIWQPDADQLARYDGRLGLEYVRRDATTGATVTKMASAHHDASGRVLLTAIYDEGQPGEPSTRWVREDRLRLVSPDELVALAEGAGLRVDQLAGDYDLRPYEPGDDRAILIASPGARRQRALRGGVRRAASGHPSR